MWWRIVEARDVVDECGSTGLPAYLSANNARKPNPVTGTVYRTDVSSADSIFSSNYTYNKGAWVLHMLRGVMGEQRFFAALRAYVSEYSYRNVTTEDFRAVCERDGPRRATPGRAARNAFPWERAPG